VYLIVNPKENPMNKGMLMAKKYDPHMMGELVEKSSGDPVMDKISLIFRELNRVKSIGESLEQMRRMLAQPGVEVQLELAIRTRGPKMTPEEARQHLIKQHPDLQELQEQDDPEMKEAVEQHINELVEEGFRPEDQSHVSMEVPPLLARDMVGALTKMAPTPDPSAAAGALHDLANTIMDPDYKNKEAE
jgi:hypothetical protein